MTTVSARQHAVNDSGADSGVRTPAGDAFSDLVTRLFRLNGLLAADGDALARPAGQTSARWQVLAMVEETPATVAQIARTLGLARQSVQRVADALADQGIVEYVDNPRHRRAKLVSMTPEGRSALSAIQARQRGWADEIGAELGAAELKRLTALLDRVLGAIAHHPVR
jgi:DNA-binding MarR family transcriptional regulator